MGQRKREVFHLNGCLHNIHTAFTCDNYTHGIKEGSSVAVGILHARFDAHSNTRYDSFETRIYRWNSSFGVVF